MGKISDIFTQHSLALPQEAKRRIAVLDAELESLAEEKERLKADNLKLRAIAKPLERDLQDSRDECKRLKGLVDSLHKAQASLEDENGRLKAMVRPNTSAHDLGNPHGYCCDHCGSPKLKRTGNRPDPMFGDMGVKQQLFTCLECNQSSAFTPDP